MKKNYLAPKSETLMAILREMCDGGIPTGNPSSVETGSPGNTGGTVTPSPHAPAVHTL